MPVILTTDEERDARAATQGVAKQRGVHFVYRSKEEWTSEEVTLLPFVTQ